MVRELSNLYVLVVQQGFGHNVRKRLCFLTEKTFLRKLSFISPAFSLPNDPQGAADTFVVACGFELDWLAHY